MELEGLEMSGSFIRVGIIISDSLKPRIFLGQGDGLPCFALVAQLVEHRFCKAVVASSSLVGGLTKFKIRHILLSSV